MEENINVYPPTHISPMQGCHGGAEKDIRDLPLVAIVGSPNVGKSVLFNRLTGAYVTVSNYPGTTVEVARGSGKLGEQKIGVVDTPGMYRLLPLTQEEQVARDILLTEKPTIVIHVVDAKNLDRMLPMTLQLIESGLPVVLAANLMDEADRMGVQIDLGALERILGIPVVGTALALGRGAQDLIRILMDRVKSKGDVLTNSIHIIDYHTQIEKAVEHMESRLHGNYRLSKRSISLLLLQRDPYVTNLVAQQEFSRLDEINDIIHTAEYSFVQPLTYVIAKDQREVSRRILFDVLNHPVGRPHGFREKLSALMINPLTGLPILATALYLLYQFVGVIGAQKLVGFLENQVFGVYINPWVDAILAATIPWQTVRDLIGGEYGLITLGIRYAVALILPIVGTFFLIFSIIEDSGYLPRLALLIDRIFKKIGLNGRAVIPMVLGFGCDTMATIVTRTLETRRERFLSTLLLALAIPCSAQLGVMMGLMAANPLMMVFWIGIVAGVFMLVGLLAARLMPGEKPTFYMELPPLRLPTLTNVLIKTYTRLEWYFREVLPMFLIASVIIWLGKLTGAFDVIVGLILPVIRWLGLPDQAAVAFLFGFFRRDYGAAGLYDLQTVMTNNQLLVAAITLTLFVPCIAQFSVTIKERGWKTALGISAFVFPFAFLIGGLVNWILNVTGITL
jgi:ferrous iron transport protein B